MKTKIKDFLPKNKIFLAPMEEVNDYAFRSLCKSAGAGLTYTGMVHPLTPNHLHLKQLSDKPGIQIFSTSPKGIKEFFKKYEKNASLFDLNLGCPAKSAKKQGFGSYLHDDLNAIESILKEMRFSTNLPITIKIRKSENALKIVDLANKYADAIAIHPRTKEQGYSGSPYLDFAINIKKRSKIPVIYSGNITKSNYLDFLKIFDFLMIGRCALGNPNIFSRIAGTKTNYNFFDYLKLALKYNYPFKQIKMHSLLFTKGKSNASFLRKKLSIAKTITEIEQIYNLL